MHVTGKFLINLVYFKPLQNRVTDENDPVVGRKKKYVYTYSPSTADQERIVHNDRYVGRISRELFQCI